MDENLDKNGVKEVVKILVKNGQKCSKNSSRNR